MARLTLALFHTICNGSIGGLRQGKAGLHMTDIKQHVGEPDQHSSDTGTSGNLGHRSTNHLEQADLFHPIGSRPLNSAVIVEKPGHKKAPSRGGPEHDGLTALFRKQLRGIRLEDSSEQITHELVREINGKIQIHGLCSPRTLTGLERVITVRNPLKLQGRFQVVPRHFIRAAHGIALALQNQKWCPELVKMLRAHSFGLSQRMEGIAITKACSNGR